MSDHKNPGHNSKKDFLKNPVEHIDITSFDSRKIISSMEKMSFVSRETAIAVSLETKDIFSIEEIIFLESNEVISICSTGFFKKSFLLL